MVGADFSEHGSDDAAAGDGDDVDAAADDNQTTTAQPNATNISKYAKARRRTRRLDRQSFAAAEKHDSCDARNDEPKDANHWLSQEHKQGQQDSGALRDSQRCHDRRRYQSPTTPSGVLAHHIDACHRLRTNERPPTSPLGSHMLPEHHHPRQDLVDGRNRSAHRHQRSLRD